MEPLYKGHPRWWPFKRGGLSWGVKYTWFVKNGAWKRTKFCNFSETFLAFTEGFHCSSVSKKRRSFHKDRYYALRMSTAHKNRHSRHDLNISNTINHCSVHTGPFHFPWGGSKIVTSSHRVINLTDPLTIYEWSCSERFLGCNILDTFCRVFIER